MALDSLILPDSPRKIISETFGKAENDDWIKYGLFLIKVQCSPYLISRSFLVEIGKIIGG
jgi:hypothetical protein